MLNKPYLVAAATLAVAATAFVGAVAWRFAFFLAPFAWTGEAERLAELLGVQRGGQLADVGAGDGALAVEMARRVGVNGTVYATEINPQRRRDIADRIARTGLANVRVIEAAADASRLPAVCCDALYMRMVFHHIEDPAAFARDAVRAVRPGGRIAVIDFAPGALWFHGRDHGVRPESAIAAFEDAGCTLRTREDRWGGISFFLLFDCGKV